MCKFCASPLRAPADIVGGSPSAAPASRSLPAGVGAPGQRTLIRGGSVLSIDPGVGDFAQGDVLIEGSRILQIAAHIDASDAIEIDASGHIVTPGFIDTHHHQFETALRSLLADAILINDGRPESVANYYEWMLQKFSLLYRPSDVYISELFGGIAQIDAGVTTVMDVSQIHHSPEHSDAAVDALKDTGRRAAFGYFEGWGEKAQYPDDAARLKSRYFASDDQLLSMVMGAEIYLPGYEKAWAKGRELGLQLAMHIVGTFGMAPTFDALAEAGQFGPDCIFIHMTGMSDRAWRKAADAGAHVSMSVPIEMHMRHGSPPMQKALDLGLIPSLSSDVECTMSADMFTQMRSAITLQRMFANDRALRGEDYPKLLSAAEVIGMATGKQADIILLDATALNVAPLNHVPGAVVTLMDRSNVSTVICGGRILKWRGEMLGHDIDKLRSELERSRDYLFEQAKVEKDLFRK
jgi:5-methylthioadenosine/S-adenosylhomocysteine deaminase